MSALTPEVEIDELPTALYRFFGTPAGLLYIGITDNLKARFAAHAADKDWWPHVARRTVEWHPTRTAALAAETEAIRAEHPLYNIKGTETPAARPVRTRRARPAPEPVIASSPRPDSSGTRSSDGIWMTWVEMRAVIGVYLQTWEAAGGIKLLCPVEELGFP